MGQSALDERPSVLIPAGKSVCCLLEVTEGKGILVSSAIS